MVGYLRDAERLFIGMDMAARDAAIEEIRAARAAMTLHPGTVAIVDMIAKTPAPDFSGGHFRGEGRGSYLWANGGMPKKAPSPAPRHKGSARAKRATRRGGNPARQ